MAEVLTGWSRAEAQGQALAEVFRIINEQTRQPVEDDPVRRVLREGRALGLANHTLLITRYGAEIPIADSAAPIRDCHGVLHGVVLVFRDGTALRQLEAQLHETRKMEALGTLAGGVAHGFNNMLAAILGFTELLQHSEVGADPRAAPYLHEGIGKSNGLFHRPRSPTPCHPAATLPADARAGGRPARPAPAAGQHWMPPAGRRLAPQRTARTGGWGRAACTAGAARGEAARGWLLTDQALIHPAELTGHASEFGQRDRVLVHGGYLLVEGGTREHIAPQWLQPSGRDDDVILERESGEMSDKAHHNSGLPE